MEKKKKVEKVKADKIKNNSANPINLEDWTEDQERVYRIVSDFCRISYERVGRRYFFLSRAVARGSKHWDYFVALDKLALAGKIVLPDYIEAQFLSPLWRGATIMPQQLFCDRAKRVGKIYSKDRKLTRRENDDTVWETMVKFFEIIIFEIRNDDFMLRFEIDGSFNVEKYIEWKSIFKDFVFYVYYYSNIDDMKKCYKKYLKEYKETVDNRITELNSVLAEDPEKEKYIKYGKKQSLRKYNLFKRIVEEIIELKVRSQK